ncbi:MULTISPECIES: hypothetical protein [unclassified Massilia]|uniref:hypothetical protein n=1 Tax=unclassified Massilia TaxID=2609279 RepID=UPI001B8416AA|nr:MULTISPECIES: hypothetical protein [unclassified Massilia]MBQ5942593.1 hypothetical protein [Massilia sp. AB1]MBQ5964782.1 hypothetical protein [Massilia sp. ZL223]
MLKASRRHGHCRRMHAGIVGSTTLCTVMRQPAPGLGSPTLHNFVSEIFTPYQYASVCQADIFHAFKKKLLHINALAMHGGKLARHLLIPA